MTNRKSEDKQPKRAVKRRELDDRKREAAALQVRGVPSKVVCERVGIDTSTLWRWETEVPDYIAYREQLRKDVRQETIDAARSAVNT